MKIFCIIPMSLLKPTAWVQVKAELVGKTEVSDKLGQALEEAANEMK